VSDPAAVKKETFNVQVSIECVLSVEVKATSFEEAVAIGRKWSPPDLIQFKKKPTYGWDDYSCTVKGVWK
jgi:hypothetical protein